MNLLDDALLQYLLPTEEGPEHVQKLVLGYHNAKFVMGAF